MNPLNPFQWECHPRAEQLIAEAIQEASRANRAIAKLSQDLLTGTSTRLFDWVDYVMMEESETLLHQLPELGFVQQGDGYQHLFAHPGAQLPRIVLQKQEEIRCGVAVHVDEIAKFLMAHGGSTLPVEGTQFGSFRSCRFSVEQEVALWLVERRGSLSLHPSQEDELTISHYHQALEQWIRRPRALSDEDRAMQSTLQLAQQLVAFVGQHRAAWTVLEAERQYWQIRNTAGQIQKNRQDRLGMGWANHDHHTFRSSRRYFSQLVHLFELLGFHCRERFYAGEEAGWGAQIMENPVCGLVLFLDVDLAPEEIAGDFAHTPLPELDRLGTIGLWCALHGDSILKAGMHHLEAQFMFDQLTDELAERGIQMMQPFSSLSYLRQAFTVGETWPVDSLRVERLLQEGKISIEEADRFLTYGAIGSHLENLQRREGYKGFHPHNVSLIIRQTDPRRQP